MLLTGDDTAVISDTGVGDTALGAASPTPAPPTARPNGRQLSLTHLVGMLRRGCCHGGGLDRLSLAGTAP